jgi:hypothetical protein
LYEIQNKFKPIIMYKTISNEIIRKFNIDYDLSEVIKDENEELTIRDWVQKYRDVVPIKDILRLLLREEFLSEKNLILFAVWCAREALKLIENPDERIVEACNVTEKFANGEATQEELFATRAAANDAIDDAYYAADVAIDDKADIAYAAAFAYSAAYCASIAASTATVPADSYTVSHTVSHYASIAASYASDAAYNAASYVADYAVYDYDTTRASQLDQLLTYFE